MKYLVLFISSFLLFSCNSKEEECDDIEIGKYLYLTNNGVLHCKQDCISVFLAKDEDGHKVTGMSFIDTLEIVNDRSLSYCTRCFNDARYEQVQRMIRRNDKDRTMRRVSLPDSAIYEY